MYSQPRERGAYIGISERAEGDLDQGVGQEEGCVHNAQLRVAELELLLDIQLGNAVQNTRFFVKCNLKLVKRFAHPSMYRNNTHLLYMYTRVCTRKANWLSECVLQKQTEYRSINQQILLFQRHFSHAHT